MEKEFIPYDFALELKELGFGSDPIGGMNGGSVFYYEKGGLYYDGMPMYSSSSHDGQIMAPLFQQAFGWFRDNHGLRVWVQWGSEYICMPMIQYQSGHIEFIDSVCLNDYEANLVCLKKLIDVVKNNQK